MAPLPNSMDFIVAVAVALRIILLDIPHFFLISTYHYLSGQYGRYHHGVSLGLRLQYTVIRSMMNHLPVPITRWITDIGLPTRILKSPRYAPYATHLSNPVVHPDFRGIWIIRNGFTTGDIVSPDLDPANSDILIYFLHGGGYFSSSPATYTLFLLRLAETIIRAGKSVSILALDYELAPEGVFPVQLEEARRGYEWLIRSKEDGGVGIERGRVLVMGDSAGGHLSLSLMVGLWRRREEGFGADGREVGVTAGEDTRPELGLLLLSPWLSLFHMPESFVRNAWTDVLSREFLYKTANRFLGPECDGAISSEKAPYLEFLNGKSRITWDEVLPEWIWVSAGKNEMFYDDVIRWMKDREGDCPTSRGSGQRICGEFDRGEPHDYAWLKTADYGVSKRFCGEVMEMGKGTDEYDAIERIGMAVVERWETIFVKE